MQFYRATLANCGNAAGAVVVIDVIRAFTTAGYALAAGGREILLAGTVDEAFHLRRRFPDTYITGEVGGLKVDGFDYGNSPVEIAAANLAGKRLIQRTSSGTQGVVRSTQAGRLLGASFACAQATAEYVLLQGDDTVTFVVTGAALDETFLTRPIHQGDEDAACADYLEALLRGEHPDPQAYLERVRSAPAANKFLDPEQCNFSAADLAFCTQLDAFDFAMPVTRRGDLLVLARSN